MRYCKTIDLWAGTTEQDIRSGKLTLQSGQWVTCGTDDQKSRYIGVVGHSVWVAHGGTNKQVNQRYMTMAHNYKAMNRQVEL